MKKNNKGFTLMEMLIVVAIIGVLVAIAIPTVSNSLTKSKQAADQANVRSAYAEASTKFLLGEGGSAQAGPMKADCAADVEIGGIKFVSSPASGDATQAKAWSANDTVKVSVDASGAKFTIESATSGGGQTSTSNP